MKKKKTLGVFVAVFVVFAVVVVFAIFLRLGRDWLRARLRVPRLLHDGPTNG